MKASEANFLKLIQKSPQFVIPIYQRNYSWTEVQCRQLWNDVLHAGRSDGVQGHFIGSIVYVERGLSTVTSQEALQVIDGQQRLTTVTLLILALARHFEQHKLDELLSAFSAAKLRNYYLVNPYESGWRHHKLCLSEADSATLHAEVMGAPLPPQPSERIRGNLALFTEWLATHARELEAICKGLSKLMVVEVALDRQQDNPQLIFESMNSTGLELTQADLIRNFVLMGLPHVQQTDLYQRFWRPMEQVFGSDAYAEHFDAFMRHYLTLKTGDVANVRQVYSAFKAHAQAGGTPDMAALVTDIHRHACWYAALALGQEREPALRLVFADLRELRVDVAYPFLLQAYADYQAGVLQTADFLELARTIESYVFRRAICAMPTNSLTKTFARLGKQIDAANYVQSVQAALLRQQSYRAFPSDEQFADALRTKDLYRFPRRNYWLRRLENHGKKERVAVENYTIEHIMPQNPALPDNWQRELGDDWQRVHAQWLHTIGNLTLTAYNSQYSDKPFVIKRDLTDADGQPIGFGASPLKLNQSLGQVTYWNEQAIAQRAERLCREAARTWARPVLPDDVLRRYDKKASAGTPTAYTRADHVLLTSGPVGDLFDALRREIMALDECVIEEYRKLYVAYKAEYNFVDIVPQTRQLKLFLNVKANELNDPERLTEDVSNVGHWGNGEVQVFLKSAVELPYVIGLIRQALERQMEETPND